MARSHNGALPQHLELPPVLLGTATGSVGAAHGRESGAGEIARMARSHGTGIARMARSLRYPHKFARGIDVHAAL